MLHAIHYTKCDSGFTQLESLSKLLFRRFFIKFAKNKKSVVLSHPPSFRALLKKPQTVLTGFTLVEMLVSVGILAVVIVAAVGIYVYAIGSQQKSTANANLQEDGQNILAMISKDTRAMRVNYSYYPGSPPTIPSPTSTLALIDDYDSSATTTIVYTYNATNKQIKRCRQAGAACDSDNKFEVMNMSNVLIQRLDFYISPSTDPSATGAANVTSTRVTVIMDLNAQQERFGQKTIRLQQTLNPRYEEKK